MARIRVNENKSKSITENNITIEDINKAKELKQDNIGFVEIYGQLLYALRDNEMYIEFTKKSGEIRKMKCTRNSEYIHKYYTLGELDDIEDIYSKDSTKATQTKNDISKRLVKVFDIEKSDFRSFSLDRLTSIKYIKNL